MTARDHARAAAQAALEELDLPAQAARSISQVMDLGEHVVDLIADEYRSRAANPRPWAVFHEAMASSLPRIRFAARWHHRRMARRYRAMILAGTSIPCARSLELERWNDKNNGRPQAPGEDQ